MADFSDKRIRKMVDEGGFIYSASAEDLSLLMAVCRPLLKNALDRIARTSEANGIVLDPLPVRPVTMASNEAKD